MNGPKPGNAAFAYRRNVDLDREAALLQMRAGDIFHPWTEVDWVGTEKTGDEIERLLNDQAAAIRRVLQNIERSHLIQLSGTHITIAVVVRDCRRDREAPLPKIASVREVQLR